MTHMYFDLQNYVYSRIPTKAKTICFYYLLNLKNYIN